ncbi:MAG TPA: hypothetical protein VGY66_32880 [Gemmataceae bacterium]|jgi:hypothetical protein|nr:hypothetical protein [Gemmataceae bacterium]
MFGRSRESCPVEPESRAWLDERLDWLVTQFGRAQLRAAQVVLPTTEFFPDAYSGSEADVRVMLDRVCGYMGLEADTIDLHFYQDRNPVHEGGFRHGTAGLYEAVNGKHRVWIEASKVHDPLALVATLAHELGHVHLLGHGRISPEAEDHELLTDLLTVFLGLGVITANAVIRESYWNVGHLGGWSINRQGYMTMPMYGYALAWFARARDEAPPAGWIRLRVSSRPRQPHLRTATSSQPAPWRPQRQCASQRSHSSQPPCRCRARVVQSKSASEHSAACSRPING